MAALFNRWLLLSILFCSLPGREEFQLQENQFPPQLIRGLHPFHVSVIEINHNVADKTLEISCKIFTDDFEKILTQDYKAKVDLTNPPNKAAMDSLVKKYIISHLSLKVNGKPVSFSYVGFENEDAAVYGYVEVDNIATLNKLEITNSLMYDMFDDQVNIMHVIVNGNRKSTKLNYPDKSTVFSW